MAVAALYDIHGNLPALEAVLEEVMALDIDQIVVGGDVVLGPMSRECLDLLTGISIPTHFIIGNCEVYVLNQMSGSGNLRLPEPVQADIRWTAEQLSTRHKDLISSWPKSMNLEIEGIGKVLFCHATPRSENEIFTRLTKEEVLRPVFEGVPATMVVCGHTHMQFDRNIAGVKVVNAGSVGMPFGPPGAYWLLIHEHHLFQKTSYNLEKAARRIVKTDYPSAHEFGGKNVMSPRSEKEMIRLFSKSELGSAK